MRGRAVEAGTLSAAALLGAVVVVGAASPVPAIELRPSRELIQAALERGRAAAAARTPPDRLYAWFGSEQELEPKGFLMTKVIGLTVMSAHFALRGETPSEAEIRQVLDEPALLVSLVIFGDRPDFAQDSYVVMTQGARAIKPVKVRFDGQAPRSPAWPKRPAFRAKVVAAFAYADFDPQAHTTISVFPPAGGEVAFALDFSAIP
jgi:hypothetical protein